MRKLILLLLLMASSLTHGQTPTNMSGLEITNKTSPNKTVFAPTRAASCSTLTNQLVGSQCFDTTTKVLYTCSTINSSGTCTSWVVAGAAAQGAAGAVQTSAGGGLLADSGCTATGGTLSCTLVKTDNSITPRFTPWMLDLRFPMTNAKNNGPTAGFQMEIQGSMTTGTQTANGFFSDLRTATAAGSGNGATQMIANGLYLEHWSDTTITTGWGTESSCWLLGSGTLGTCRGLSSAAQVSSGTMSNAYGIEAIVRQNPSGSPGPVTGFPGGAGTGVITNGVGVNITGDFSSSSGSPTTTGYNGIQSNLTIGSGNTVSTYKGIYIPAPTGGGTLTNSYGLWITANNKAASANWGLYVESPTTGTSKYASFFHGSAKNHFGGDLELEGATYDSNKTTLTVVDPTANRTVTLPDASGTVVLDPNVTPPTTAAGYYQSGDSKGMQFFPGSRRSYSEAVSLLKRSETNNTAGDSNAFVFIGDSILSMSTRSALRTFDKRFRVMPGYIPISSSLNYASAPDITLDATTGTWTVYGNNGGSETAATNRQQFGIDGGSYKATAAASWGITSNVAVNKARIWYLKFSGGGTFNYCTTAGCSPGTTINTSNATDDAGHVDISFSKYTPGNVVRLAWASGTVYIYGVELYSTFASSEDQNDILEPIFLTHGGNLLDSTNAAGFSTYAAVGANPIWDTFYTTIAPFGIAIMLGTNDACRTRGGGATNDCLTGRTSTQYSTDYQTLLTGLLARTPKKTDVVLVTTPARGYDNCSGDMATFETLADQYRTSVFSLATTNGLSIWDLRKYWPGYTDANALGLYSGDCTHPSAVGQALITAGLGNIISPSEGWNPRRNYIEDDCGTYASASTVTLLNRKCSYADITGSTAVTTLSGPAGENLCQPETRGRQIKLGCASGATWTIAAGGAGNIKLNSPWTCADNRALTLTCDGSAASGNWIATGTDSPSTFMSCQSWWFGSATGSVADNMRSNGGSGAYLFHPVPKASTFRSISCVSDGGTTGGTITMQFCTPGNGGCGDGQVVLSAGSTANTAYTGTSCTSNCVTAANSTYVVKITTSGVTSTTNINCNVCTAMVPW